MVKNGFFWNNSKNIGIWILRKGTKLIQKWILYVCIRSNKVISIMRGKSPRSDVEMTKKLNFVAAILDFWRAFLYQFWVHTYKIHFWISFVLCVNIFELFQKNPFFTIYKHSSKGRNSVKFFFFSTGSEHSN